MESLLNYWIDYDYLVNTMLLLGVYLSLWGLSSLTKERKQQRIQPVGDDEPPFDLTPVIRRVRGLVGRPVCRYH